VLYHRPEHPSEEFSSNTTNTMLMIENLATNMDYIFIIRAYTNKGAGPWSKKLPFRTFGHCEWLPWHPGREGTLGEGVSHCWNLFTSTVTQYLYICLLWLIKISSILYSWSRLFSYVIAGQDYVYMLCLFQIGFLGSCRLFSYVMAGPDYFLF